MSILSLRMLLCASVAGPALATLTEAAQAQTEWRDTHCYYDDEPGRTLSISLPGGYALKLERSRDDDASGGNECSAHVLAPSEAIVWQATGFGTGIDGWTGHDVDGDGFPDAIVTIDTGGGNRCCWYVHVLRITPTSVRDDTLEVNTSFSADPDGRTVLWDVVPFYGLGPDMADSPVVHLARQYRGGQLVEITPERCPAMLADTLHDFPSLRSEWEAATPAMREAAQQGQDTAWAVQRVRVAVSSLALQYLACGTTDDAQDLVYETWPASRAAERWRVLLDAWAKVAAHRPSAASRVPWSPPSVRARADVFAFLLRRPGADPRP